MVSSWMRSMASVLFREIADVLGFLVRVAPGVGGGCRVLLGAPVVSRRARGPFGERLVAVAVQQPPAHGLHVVGQIHRALAPRARALPLRPEGTGFTRGEEPGEGAARVE